MRSRAGRHLLSNLAVDTDVLSAVTSTVVT